ncbi:uncharacterized protein LOC102802968 [Saccoglossus kowalevskii]|uniref:Uncharacterized protein LOC102802968 n=1 Tax=Saccoglossus kowalevskii TaxID=10224 RepID=A0ABM0M3W0_SACKO|nr:PREDICTED: uncharacterized protein LOC102802968 [Saccoglossus kowalevskii]
MLCCSNGCGHTCQPFETDTDLGKYVNVTYMGMLHSCSATTVDIHYEYIMLLTMNDAGELEPDEINLQTAAFVADEEHWRDLGVLCNIATTPPIGERTCDEKVESRQIQVVDGCYMYSGSVSTYVGRIIVASLLLFVIQSSMVFF